MKKSLLSFLMLMLCIALLPQGTVAQDLPGGSSGGYLDPSAPDEGIADGGITAPINATPPASVKNVKRNNGNGTTTTGLAEARLTVTNSGGDYTLTRITSLDMGTTYQANWKDGYKEKGYISYGLESNKMPAKKLLFHFKCNTTGKTFCIPETN